MSARAWIERRWWWLPLLVVVVLNLIALVWYTAVYSGLARSVDQQLEQRRRELAGAQAALERQQQTAERLRTNADQLDAFYTTRLAPPSERLTDVIREVRRLARTAGLQPSAIDYPRDDLEDYGLVKRSFSFAVRGSYAQLRQFINLLELTDSFLTLEEVQMTGRGNQAELRISLRLSTLFVLDEEGAGTVDPTSEEAAS